MTKLTLQRFASHTTQGTFGSLTWNNQSLFTVEQPWRDNQVKVSCIPAGTYTCNWVVSPKFGLTLMVMDVPGRSHILFHVANKASELQGCVGLGLQLGAIGNEWAVLNSRVAVSRFLLAIENKHDIQLEVVDG